MLSRTVEWPVEEIPDDGILYRTAHKNLLLGHEGLGEDEVPPGVIKVEDELSTDWDRYSTPEESRSRARSPDDTGVVFLPVGALREQTRQRVEHRPLSTNRSHSLIVGKKDPETRLKLRRLARWVIRIAP